jgi:predicted TIM-barrel enzyme
MIQWSVSEILDAAVKMSPEIIVLYHRGPIIIPSDARFVIERVNGVHGFFGASSIERLPPGDMAYTTKEPGSIRQCIPMALETIEVYFRQLRNA